MGFPGLYFQPDSELLILTPLSALTIKLGNGELNRPETKMIVICYSSISSLYLEKKPADTCGGWAGGEQCFHLLVLRWRC